MSEKIYIYSYIFTLGRKLKISCVLIVRKILYSESYIHTGDNAKNPYVHVVREIL